MKKSKHINKSGQGTDKGDCSKVSKYFANNNTELLKTYIMKNDCHVKSKFYHWINV